MEKISKDENTYESVRLKYSISKEQWSELITEFDEICQDLELDRKQREILLRKFTILYRSGFMYKVDEIIGAVLSNPDVYSDPGKPELITALNNYLAQKKNNNREPWKKIQESELDVPAIIEASLQEGKYYLTKLFTRTQISQNGLALNTCIQEDSLERYYNKSFAEKIEILSITNAEHEPLITIIYDKEKGEILQIRKKDNERVDGSEEFYPAISEALKVLIKDSSYDYQGKAGIRKIKRVHDLEDLKTDYPVLLNSEGDLIDLETAAEANYENILGGTRIKITSNFDVEKVLEISEFAALDLDMTEATENQKNSLRVVKGSIVDNSTNISGYSSLETVEGGLYFNQAKRVSLDSIKKISGKLIANSCSSLDMTSLEYVGSRVEINSAQEVNLKNLNFVGGILKLDKCLIVNLPKLKMTGFSIFAGSAKIIEIDSFVGTEGVLYAGNAENISTKNLSRSLKIVTSKNPSITAPFGSIEITSSV